MNNINKTIAALFMAATFLPMSAQTTAKKECCRRRQSVARHCAARLAARK